MVYSVIDYSRFQNNYIVETMRQGQHDSYLNQSQIHHSETTKRQNISKKRIIKKDKNIKENELMNHCTKLTKEQRAKIQKQKNRQAAQRSRDMHKEYVCSLEKELEELKEYVNKRLCFRCKQQIEPQLQNIEADCHNIQFCNRNDQLGEEEIFSNNSTDNQINLLEDKPQFTDSFLRMENQEQFSYLKMMLFISMIAIGVILYINPSETPQTRNLVQIYNQPVTQALHRDEFTIISNQNEDYEEEFKIQKISSGQINKGLVHKSSVINDQCIQSLLSRVNKQNSGLRSIHEKSSSFDRTDGILLCSYEQPKKYSLTAQTNSALIKMFLMGAEIKQMLTSSLPLNRFITNSIQLNGIYQIAAQVKQVELISQHNCLL